MSEYLYWTLTWIGKLLKQLCQYCLWFLILCAIEISLSRILCAFATFLLTNYLIGFSFLVVSSDLYCTTWFSIKHLYNIIMESSFYYHIGDFVFWPGSGKSGNYRNTIVEEMNIYLIVFFKVTKIFRVYFVVELAGKRWQKIKFIFKIKIKIFIKKLTDINFYYCTILIS